MSADSLDLQARPANRNKRRRPIPPGLLRRAAAARYLAVGLSTLDRLNAAGLVPKPIRLAGSLCWSRVELAAWIKHGCPARDVWAAVWSGVVARRSSRAK